MKIAKNVKKYFTTTVKDVELVGQLLNVKPGDFKVTRRWKLTSTKPIFFEEVPNGQLGVILRADSWINDSARKATSTEAQISVDITDRDNMPPLFCTESELNADRTCDISIERVTKKRREIIPGGFLVLLTAIDGDRGLNEDIGFELVSQYPDIGLFWLMETPVGAELKLALNQNFNF